MDSKALRWIKQVINTQINQIHDLDGQTLIKTINKIHDSIVPQWNEGKDLHPLRERENINLYLEACWKLGLPGNNIFLPSDLQLKLNPNAVVKNIVALSLVSARFGVGEPVQSQDEERTLADIIDLNIIEFIDMCQNGFSYEEDRMQGALSEMLKEVFDDLMSGFDPDSLAFEELTNNAFAIDGVRRIFVHLLRQFVIETSMKEVILAENSIERLGRLASSLIRDLDLECGGDYITAKLLMNSSFYFVSKNGIYLYHFFKRHDIWSNFSYWEEIYWDSCAACASQMPNRTQDSYSENQRKIMFELLCSQSQLMREFSGLSEAAVGVLMEGIDPHIGLSAEDSQAVLESIDEPISETYKPYLFLFSGQSYLKSSQNSVNIPSAFSKSEMDDLIDEIEDLNDLVKKKNDVIKEQEDELEDAYAEILEHKEKIKKLEESYFQSHKSESFEELGFKGGIQRMLILVDKCTSAATKRMDVTNPLNDSIKKLSEHLINDMLVSVSKIKNREQKESYEETCEDFRDAFEFFTDASAALLQDHNDTLIGHLNEVSKEVKDVLKEFSATYDSIGQALKKQSEEDNKRLISAVRLLSEEKQSLTLQNKALEKKVEEFSNYIDSLKQSTKSLAQQNQIASEHLKEVAEQKANIELLKKELEHTNQNNNDLKYENQDLKKKIDEFNEFSNNIKQFEEIISEKDKLLSEQKNTSKLLYQELNSLKKSNESAELARTKALVVKLQSELTELKSQKQSSQPQTRSRQASASVMKVRRFSDTLQKIASNTRKQKTSITAPKERTRKPSVKLPPPETSVDNNTTQRIRATALRKTSLHQQPSIIVAATPAVQQPSGAPEKFVVRLPMNQMTSFLYTPDSKLSSIFLKVLERRKELSMESHVMTDTRGNILHGETLLKDIKNKEVIIVHRSEVKKEALVKSQNQQVNPQTPKLNEGQSQIYIGRNIPQRQGTGTVASTTSPRNVSNAIKQPDNIETKWTNISQSTNSSIKARPSVVAISQGSVANMREKFLGFQERRASKASNSLETNRRTSRRPSMPKKSNPKDMSTLTSLDYIRFFQMTKPEFDILPNWKKESLKRQAGIF